MRICSDENARRRLSGNHTDWRRGNDVYLFIDYRLIIEVHAAPARQRESLNKIRIKETSPK
jgi:hypothetical protein